MKVVMLIFESPEDFQSRKKEGPAAQHYWASWKAYMESISEKTVGGNALAGPEGATSIRVRSGERQIQDGPFAESKEALGGYIVFEVDSIEEAMELAAACPTASTGHVELRPVMETPE